MRGFHPSRTWTRCPSLATLGATRAMIPNLTIPKRQAYAIFVMVLLLTALTATVTSPAQAAVPLLDIAYKSGANIWIQRADGTKTQLTSNVSATRDEYVPEVSPDGLQIAFAEHGAIWIMSIGGSNPHQVSSLGSTPAPNTTVVDSLPRWAPDGTRISFERSVESFDATGTPISAISDIVLLNVFSGFETTITNSHHNASGPAAWSPDSNRLAYWKTDTAGLSIIGANGSGEHPLSQQTPRYPSDPAWSPDGRTIYFDTDDPNVIGIQYFTSPERFATTLNVTSTKLTTDVSDFEPHLTPDGKAVGFRRGGTIMTANLADGTLSQQPPTGVTGFSFIPTPQNPPTASATYVALGDSYSAGEGNAPFQPDSDNPSTFDACHRSDAAYGPLLDKDLKLGSILFKACSGAVTNDFFAPNHDNPNGEPDQTSWLSDQTKTVTLTVGGNDLAFPNVLDHCITGYRPDDTPFINTSFFDGTGCRKNTKGQQDIDDRLQVLAGKKSGVLLAGPPIHSELSVLERIHQQAKNAHIYIAGYPQLFGSNPKYYDGFKGHGSGHRCLVGSTQADTFFGHLFYGTVLFYVDFQDAKWMNDQANALNTVIQGAADQAKAEGIQVTYVEPQFDKHTLCDALPSWLYELLPEGNSLNPGSFHPTIAGQRLGYEAAFKTAMS